MGVHDLLAPACDPLRYLEDFGEENHRNCGDNLNNVGDVFVDIDNLSHVEWP